MFLPYCILLGNLRKNVGRNLENAVYLCLFPSVADLGRSCGPSPPNFQDHKGAYSHGPTCLSIRYNYKIDARLIIIIIIVVTILSITTIFFFIGSRCLKGVDPRNVISWAIVAGSPCKRFCIEWGCGSWFLSVEYAGKEIITWFTVKCSGAR